MALGQNAAASLWRLVTAQRAPAEVAAEMDEDAENDATLDACGGETHWHVETRCVACVWRVIGDQLEISALSVPQ